MKSNTLLLFRFLATYCVVIAFNAGLCAQDVQRSGTTAAMSAAVFLLDDQTGAELERVHGIKPFFVEDLEILLDGVIDAAVPVRLCHEVVDDDSAANSVATMAFEPYSGGQPPKAPSTGLPLRQLVGAMKTYQTERGAWQRGVADYRNTLLRGVEQFIQGIAARQGEVAERFDQMLAARNGRDFNRSDVAGCVLAANQCLKGAALRILVANTDAEDLPRLRKARKTPFKVEELDPAIHIIFVNTSHLPERSVLFKGVPNPIHHCDSTQEAMKLVVSLLEGRQTASPAKVTSSVTAAGPTVTQ